MEGTMTCALRAIVVVLVMTLHSGSCCDENWTAVGYGNHCFKVFAERVDRDTAQKRCQEIGASLVLYPSMQSVIVFSALDQQQNIASKVDIDLKKEEFWMERNTINRNLTLTTEQESEQRICYLLNHRSIRPENCSRAAPFICEKLDARNLYSSLCPEQSVLYNGYCYWMTRELSFNDTLDDCVAKGGQLFHMHNRNSLESISSFNRLQDIPLWTSFFKVGNRIQCSNGEPFDNDSAIFYGNDGNCVISQNGTVFRSVSCEVKARGLCWRHYYQSDNIRMNSTASSITGLTYTCPHGYNWKEDKKTGFCYWETSYETERLSWDDARKYCQSYGGDLASFHSLEEEKIGLSFQYGSLEHPYWIGLQRNLDTGSFAWSDETPQNYINWFRGEPSTDQRMRCVQMDAMKKQWTTSYCGVLSWFICKAPKQPDPKAPIPPTPEPLVNCLGSSSGYFFDGYCYEMKSMVYSWHAAKEYCEDRDTHLISIHSNKEIDFVLRLLNSNRAFRGNRIWIGLNSLGLDGEFQWTDNSVIDFTNWDSTEPNNFQNQEKCGNMYIGNGFWNDENCNSPMSFICKRKNITENSTIVSTTASPITGYCQNNWFMFGGRCYLPIGSKETERTNWRNASLYCHSLGGHLASVRDSRDQAFLGYILQELKLDAWIGLHDTIHSGLYYWTDNGPLTYTHWAPGEPSLFGKKEDCVIMLYGSQNGFWADEVCERNLPFICQKYIDPSIPTLSTPSSTRCVHPVGWLRSGYSCFKVYDQVLLSYKAAESSCSGDGGHLVSASDFGTQAVVEFLAMTHFDSNETFWIGLQINDNSVMKWVNEWPFTLSKWDENEPTDVGNPNTCFVSTSLGLWRKASCQEEKKYICQVRAGKPPTKISPSGHCPTASKIDIGLHKCFAAELEQAVEWHAANFQCFVEGGVLASFHSLGELYQIGRYLQIAKSPIFIGLSRNSNGGFIWSDGSPVDFVNWDQGEPKNNDHCVALIVSTLKWRIIPCYIKLPYLCSFVKVNSTYEENSNALEADSNPNGDKTQELSSGTIVAIVFFILILSSAVIFAFYHFGFRRHNHFRLFSMENQSTSFENVLYSDNCNIEFQDKSTAHVRH